MAALCAAFILAGTMTSCSSPSDEVGEKWTEDYAAALAAARETNRPLLLAFTGSDWCPPCKALKRNVFDTAEFKAYAADNLVLVSVDFPRHHTQSDEITHQNAQLQSEFGIDAYPTMVLLHPSDERELGRPASRAAPGAFIDEITKMAKMTKK